MTSAIYGLACVSVFFAEAYNPSNCKDRAVADGRNAGATGGH
jgi:hypothetical protein